MGKDFEYYGALKALCEKAAEEAMPGRVTIVRPGYIVGPDDPSGRFTYWPVRGGPRRRNPGPRRARRPGAVHRRPRPRRLARQARRRRRPPASSTPMGPEKRLGMGEFLESCRRAGKAESKLTWVTPEFVEEQKIQLPIWAPYRGKTRGFHTRTAARALKAGLRPAPAFRDRSRYAGLVQNARRRRPHEARRADRRAGSRRARRRWHKRSATGLQPPSTASCTAASDVYRGSYPSSRRALAMLPLGEWAMWSHVAAASSSLTVFRHSSHGR